MLNNLADLAASSVPLVALVALWISLIPFAILEELEHAHRRGRRRRKHQ